MWESFFGFKKTPFSDSPDAKQLFASQAWNQVKTRLEFLAQHHGVGLVTGEVGAGDYAGWAAALDMNAGAVKVALHRLRRRFGELLRSEIAHTVSTPEEIDDEIRHLFAAIAS